MANKSPIVGSSKTESGQKAGQGKLVEDLFFKEDFAGLLADVFEAVKDLPFKERQGKVTH